MWGPSKWFASSRLERWLLPGPLPCAREGAHGRMCPLAVCSLPRHILFYAALAGGSGLTWLLLNSPQNSISVVNLGLVILPVFDLLAGLSRGVLNVCLCRGYNRLPTSSRSQQLRCQQITSTLHLRWPPDLCLQARLLGILGLEDPVLLREQGNSRLVLTFQW